MGVPDGDDPVRAGRGRPGQGLGQGGPAGLRGPGDVVRVHDVQHAFERPQDVVAAGQSMGSSCMSPLSVRMSCCSSQTAWLRSAMAILPRRYFGSLPDVALSP